jgi:hypothetical protein
MGVLLKTIGAKGLVMLRWYLGVSWLLCGVAGVIAAPIMIAFGNAGGVYMFVGGVISFLLGRAIHPWGHRLRRGSMSN